MKRLFRYDGPNRVVVYLFILGMSSTNNQEAFGNARPSLMSPMTQSKYTPIFRHQMYYPSFCVKIKSNKNQIKNNNITIVDVYSNIHRVFFLKLGSPQMLESF